jgi:hypothetical protein
MVSRVTAPSLLQSCVIGILGATVVLACGGTEGSSSGSSGSSSGAAGDASADRRLPGPFRPANTSCPVVIETPELLASPHVPEGTPITYNSNPPSSGPHYPVWANFQEFTVPLDEGYLVHSLEHGAVALLHKCDVAAPGCAATIESLRKIRESIATDPSCDPAVRVRVIIAPFPKLDMPVGAVAWGFTYKADCVDVPTLTQFVNDNYAKSPENICFPGRSF